MCNQDLVMKITSHKKQPLFPSSLLYLEHMCDIINPLHQREGGEERERDIASERAATHCLSSANISDIAHQQWQSVTAWDIQDSHGVSHMTMKWTQRWGRRERWTVIWQTVNSSSHEEVRWIWKWEKSYGPVCAISVAWGECCKVSRNAGWPPRYWWITNEEQNWFSLVGLVLVVMDSRSCLSARCKANLTFWRRLMRRNKYKCPLKPIHFLYSMWGQTHLEPPLYSKNSSPCLTLPNSKAINSCVGVIVCHELDSAMRRVQSLSACVCFYKKYRLTGGGFNLALKKCNIYKHTFSSGLLFELTFQRKFNPVSGTWHFVAWWLEHLGSAPI